MSNAKSSMQGLLAIAALAMAGSGMPMTTAATVSPKNQRRYEEYLAQQKRLAESGWTADQQQWNKVVDDKRAAKKGKK